MPAVVDLAAMRDAMATLGADPQKINPLVPVDLVIDHSVMVDDFGTPNAFEQERRDANTSATASATRSCAGARRRSTISASCRPAPASATRSTSNTWRRRCGRATSARTAARHLRLSRHAGRHRQPHHHGQRPRRARLGRRRHRGRGGHARPADLDADPRGRSASADRQAARKARPRPTWCSPSPRCCARRAWSASSSSSTGRASTT